jgi:hypothetical protein
MLLLLWFYVCVCVCCLFVCLLVCLFVCLFVWIREKQLNKTELEKSRELPKTRTRYSLRSRQTTSQTNLQTLPDLNVSDSSEVSILSPDRCIRLTGVSYIHLFILASSFVLNVFSLSCPRDV